MTVICRTCKSAHTQKLHERALRVVYKNRDLTFQQLLEKDNSFKIHERNLQKLATEMYKVKQNLCPKPFQELFTPSMSGWFPESKQSIKV